MEDETRQTAIELNGAQVRQVTVKKFGPIGYIVSETTAHSGMVWSTRHVAVNIGRWNVCIQVSRIHT